TSEFVERFQRRVFGLAFTIVGDSRAAEDVAQEALLRAWRHGPAFDPRRASVATWLLSITRNLAIDALRLRRALPTDPATFLTITDASDRRAPEHAAVASDEVGRLRAALADLPPEQCRALVLAAFYGQTAQEVATAEGIPLGTAKTRIRSAMGKLRGSLVQEGGSA
ncbi:MAG: RNA polymerase sigma factor, partial [Acidimicrobiales bacterium]